MNGAAPTRSYFGDFATGKYLFSDPNNIALDLCSTKVSGTSTRDSAKDGYYDIMNVLWFKGSDGIYTITGGKY